MGCLRSQGFIREYEDYSANPGILTRIFEIAVGTFGIPEGIFDIQ